MTPMGMRAVIPSQHLQKQEAFTLSSDIDRRSNDLFGISLSQDNQAGLIINQILHFLIGFLIKKPTQKRSVGTSYVPTWARNLKAKIAQNCAKLASWDPLGSLGIHMDPIGGLQPMRNSHMT